MRLPGRLNALKRQLFRRQVGEMKLKRLYKHIHGKNLIDVENAETFSEKIFHRLIALNRFGNPAVTQISDKYRARDYIRRTIGEKYLTTLLWSGLNPSDLPFDDLPSKCMAKTNHGSGGNIVLSKNIDRSRVIDTLKHWLSENYYWHAREFQYYEITPRILVEELLDDGHPNGPLDFRFWCFNGRPEVIQVDNNTHTINPFYDVGWNKLTLHYREQRTECDVAIPTNLSEMISIASKLSSNFDFVRVDLYNIYGKVYFGEMTFTPLAGHLLFKPPSWDRLLGQKWKLSERGFVLPTA